MRNHSAAQSVTRNLETQAIFRGMKESTPNEKPLSCAKCDKAFRDLTELKQHERRNHTLFK